jgi:hypothetical protein
VAAKFQGYTFNGLGGERGEEAADGGRSGKGQGADARVGGEPSADARSVASQHLERPRRETRSFGERRKGECRERRLGRGENDDRAASGEGSAGLAENHGRWEVPWRYRRRRADGLAADK